MGNYLALKNIVEEEEGAFLLASLRPLSGTRVVVGGGALEEGWKREEGRKEGDCRKGRRREVMIERREKS